MTAASQPQVRVPLPRPGERYLADGGLETSLIFHHQQELRHFAAYELLGHEPGRAVLRAYFEPFIALARELDRGLVLETPTWRANPDWGRRLGHGPAELDRFNRAGVDLAQSLRAGSGLDPQRVVGSGVLGPRYDGYVVERVMELAEATAYHRPQLESFAAAGVDAVTAFTLTTWQEGAGVVRAAVALGLPSVISFTVETDGCLPSGQPLGEAIQAVDAATGGAASCFMINCAHPLHFADALASGEPWLDRLGGIRANASRCSHAELEAMETLDDGDPQELADRYREILDRLPGLRVLGGCCGTDHRHISAIGHRCCA
jgi:homocysteine S-methyltransferase